ncbi:MAG: hypothetical protein IH960_13170, partial [Chloroflexi bacterium]|nr:hypothetical protein [Chloroflexota bacterium]
STFLKNAAQVKPIVLILDDLHWSDKPSLLLLEFFARELSSSRILLVGTYRDMELNRRHPLSVTLGDLTRERLFERVLLRGLIRSDVSNFIEIAAGVKPPRGLVDAVFTQTEGNPLFVTETVRLLIQEGEFTPDRSSRSDSSWNIRIPEGVREVIGRRLDRLSERTNEALTIASVIGRQFTFEQLNAVMENSTENQLYDVVDESLASRTIEELPEEIGLYQFTHALIQETLLGELSATRKVRMHAQIAESFERLYGSNAESHASELASHFIEAEAVVSPARLVRYAVLAGEQAYRAMAFEEATRLFEIAVRVSDNEPNSVDRAMALRGLGISLGQDHWSNSQAAFDRVSRAFEIYVELGETAEALKTADSPLFYPNIIGAAKFYSDALGHAERNTAIEAALQIRYAGSLVREMTDTDSARTALNRAIEIARQIPDLELELSATVDLSALAKVSDDSAEDKLNQDAAFELISANNMSGPIVDESFLELLQNSIELNLELGDMTAARDSANLCREVGERLGYRRARIGSLARYQIFKRHIGELDEAIEVCTELRATRGQETVLGSNIAATLNTRGDFAFGIEVIAQAREQALVPGGMTETTQYAMVPGAMMAFGLRHYPGVFDVEEVKKFLEAAKSARGVLPLHSVAQTVAAGFISLAEEDLVAAKKCLEYLAQHADRIDHTSGIVIGRLVGLLESLAGLYDEAAPHFDGAIEFAGAREMRPELAWAHSDYAEMLLKRANPGDLDRANEHQDEAIAIATEIGMKPLLEKVLAQREILKA